MGKSKNKSFRIEDRRFNDGYKIEKRKKINKIKQKRFDSAIKSNNIDELLNLQDIE